MIIGYVVNQYPKVSHSFIRREIRAIEALGGTVARFALRGWDAALTDRADLAEQAATTYLLRDGARPLLAAALRQALTNGRRFAAAVRQTGRMLRRTDRSLFLHLVTLAEACLLAEAAARAGVRHLHAHFGTNSAEVTMLASLLAGIPYSFTVHGPDEFDRPTLLKLRDKARHAKFVVAISSFCASQLYRWLDLADWPKVQTVRCGIDGSFVEHGWRPPSHPRRLVCAGRLSAQKGHLLLIRAVGRLVRQGIVLELTLVGDGEMRGEIERAIAEEYLEQVVSITGWVDEATMREHMLAGRGMILASFAEGLPVVIMEAMALGRAVLAPQIAAIPELVEPGLTGWLFPAGSVEATADAMRRCLSASDEELAAMGRLAQEVVRERHSQEREAAKLLRLIIGQFPQPSEATHDLAIP